MIIISRETTLPCPSMVGMSCWEMTAFRVSESCIRTCSCWWGGNTSMMRSTVLGALEVCRVDRTRWPVSADVMAMEMVSRSRISPTSMTSGSSRSAERSALEKDFMLLPSSRWLMMLFLCSWTYSMGSSMVMMCSPRSLLIRSIMAARVVDLPLPVTPVTSTSPEFNRARSPSIEGSPNLSRVGT